MTNISNIVAALQQMKFGSDSLFAKATVATAGAVAGSSKFEKVATDSLNTLAKDPAKAAALAGQVAKLYGQTINGLADLQEKALPFTRSPGVRETTVTERVETKDDGTQVTKRTTTTTEERTTDNKSQAALARLFGNEAKNIGAGLRDGEIRIGNETISLGQILSLLSTLEELGKSEKPTDKELPANKPVVDINEKGVVGNPVSDLANDLKARQEGKVEPSKPEEKPPENPTEAKPTDVKPVVNTKTPASTLTEVETILRNTKSDGALADAAVTIRGAVGSVASRGHILGDLLKNLTDEQLIKLVRGIPDTFG